MSKTIKKDDKNSQEPLKLNLESTTESIDIPKVTSDIRPISVTIEGFRHISRSFPISDIYVTAKYLNQNLGQTIKYPVTDDEYIEAYHQFTLDCDLNSPTEIDSLISNPVEFTIVETYGSFDLAAYSNVTQPSLPQTHYQGFSVESEEDLFKWFSETKQEDETPVPEKVKVTPQTISKKDGTKRKPSGTRQPKRSPSNKGKKESRLEKSEEVFVDVTPRIVGTCTLDLLPLFLGQEQVLQTIPLVVSHRVFDETMIAWKEIPKVVIRVKVEETWDMLNTKLSNLVSLTIESMYNIPNIMTPEMEYCVCTLLPSVNSEMEPVVLCNGTYKTTRDIDQLKFWPGLTKNSNLSSATNYRIDPNIDDIHNQADVNLNEILTQDVPRIEWNYLRRRYVEEDGCANLYSFLKKHRHLIIEVLMRTRRTMKETSEIEISNESARSKNRSQPSVKSSAGKSKKRGSPIGEYLHLMAVVDVSALLYPGVNKLHIACPLTTFHEIEAFEAAGLKNSFFIPKQEEAAEEESPKKEKRSRELSPKSDSSKSSGKKDKKKSSGGGSGKKEQNIGKNLQELLPPPPPPPPEPSQKVYNENGQRTFLILEIELLQPIARKREIEDITEQLHNLFPIKPPIPKEIITARLAQEMYRDTIRKLMQDFNFHYSDYIKDLEKCECDGSVSKPDFITYLNRIGVYPTYLNSLTKVASVIVKDKFTYNGNCDLSDFKYQSFISDVFAYLIEEMNIVINEIVTYGLESKPIGSLAALDDLLLYAKEACELNAYVLAERYHLERVARDDEKADYWFDYAVFLMEMKEEDRAYECVKKALAIDVKHRYCLVLGGILMASKKHITEAETCFLYLTSEYPFWVEGWGIFLMFYKHICRYDGEQGCLTMIKKLGGNDKHIDYFTATDDLAWTSSICPDDPFFKIAILLIKLRCFHYAEIALSYIIPTKKNGLTDYLSAVICYYCKQYHIALKHLEKAEELHGFDYGTAALKGHCLLANGFLKQSLSSYLHILQSYNRPDDIHMVYVKTAVIYEELKNLQEARKLMLLACKYSPTPYTWMTAGLLYYKQNDVMSAEACLTEANACDRKLPEVWAYLTLINVQLERLTEAEFCQRRALKTNLNDSELLSRMDDALRSLRKKEEQKRTTW